MNIKIKNILKIFVIISLILLNYLSISHDENDLSIINNELDSQDDYNGYMDWSRAFNRRSTHFKHEKKKRKYSKNIKFTDIIHKSKNRLRKKSLNYFKLIPNVVSVIRNNCTDQACYPPIKNILIGRKKFLYASSTCGLYLPERFCLLSNLPSRNQMADKFFNFFVNNKSVASNCMTCDSREEFNFANNTASHRIENIVAEPRSSQLESHLRAVHHKWWQSENGVQQVYIQFDLESEFVLSHILIRFRTFPPASMFFEKSNDFGRTWKQIVYFASNCNESFPHISTVKPTNLYKPYCVGVYSNFPSTTNNEVVYRPLSGLTEHDPIQLQSLLKFTNLRINLTQMHMFGDNLINYSDDVMAKYYYAINEMKILGTCFCNGHASLCKPAKNIHYDSEAAKDMLYSECQCEHNTEGSNCERCLPLYNDKPWKAAKYEKSNECVKCNCNNHATSCHFDMEVFVKNNRTSGGVCDNCLHNTEGNNCERCKKNFYRDTSVPIDSPFTCKPCKCNPKGTLSKYGQGEPSCEKEKTCECKLNVQGENCDRCKHGYFNLSLSNPSGCQKCDCNVNGTVNNIGCDKKTGKCSACKTNVIGDKCDKCRPGFYGLNGQFDGCLPCNCAPGNSYSNLCDQETGQCSCKPHLYGRRCNYFEEGFFCPSLDHIVLEAEDAQRVNNHSALHKSIDYIDNEILSWTGIGFLKIYEGGIIKFNYAHNYSTGLYDILLRYQSSIYDWRNINFKIRNLGPIYYNSTLLRNKKDNTKKTCHQLVKKQKNLEDVFIFLKQNERYEPMFIKYCFEQFSLYEITLSFYSRERRKVRSAAYISAKDTPNIMIDSIVLIPNFDLLMKNIEALDISAHKTMEKAFKCRRRYFGLPREKDILCDRAICQATIDIFGLIPCQCDPVGSENNKCNTYGGQCLCKPNVYDRKCNKCRPISWGFSQNGCQLCNCDSYGSHGALCDTKTGQCECYENRYGKTCGDCLPGFYGPPRCEKCECNGFSEICTSTGVCIDCEGNTEGDHCERCHRGYYGDPLANIPCSRCLCPGVYGNYFADECSFDRADNTFKCYCKPGYVGEKCEKCDWFYYGNPQEPGGSCKKCDCNNNTNTCDPITGECKDCLYSTSGFNCERCKPGYYGNAQKHDCRPCHCNPYGTVGNSLSNCESETGHCECLPKVLGARCDECAENFWNLENGKGCEACNCDTTGTYANSTSCDQKTGQCNCIEERGGRKCDECPFGYWGNPSEGCNKCDCNMQGVETLQCNKTNGACICLKGIVGTRCDSCARGTTGKAPLCLKCGECFDNWDLALTSLKDELIEMEKKQTNHFNGILHRANLADFNREYHKLEDKVNEIYFVLFNNVTESGNKTRMERNLNKLIENTKLLRNKIEKLKEMFKKRNDIINGWNLNATLEIRRLYEIRNAEVDEQLKIALTLKESFLNGASASIENSKQVSDKALQQIKESSSQIEKNFNYTFFELKDKLSATKFDIEFKLDRLKDNVNSSKHHLDEVEASLVKLNTIVCAERTLDQLEDMERNFYDCSDDSLYSKYHQIVKLNQTFESLKLSKEQEIKSNLTEITRNKFLYKSNYKDTVHLQNSINLTISEINLRKELISELLKSTYSYSDKYIKDKIIIEENCDNVLNISIDFKTSNSDFETIIRNINLYSNRLLNEAIDINAESKLPLLQATVLNDTIVLEANEKIKEHEKLNVYNEITSNLTNTQQKIIDSFKDFEKSNNDLIGIQMSTNASLNIINFNISKINEETEEIVNIMDKQELNPNNEINKGEHFDLVFKVANVKWSIKAGSQNIKSLSKKLDDLIDELKNLSNENGSYENLKDLLELQEKIRNKQKEMDSKIDRIKEFKTKNKDMENKLASLRKELEKLKLRTMAIKTEISDKLDFSNTCQ